MVLDKKTILINKTNEAKIKTMKYKFTSNCVSKSGLKQDFQSKFIVFVHLSIQCVIWNYLWPE